MDILIRRVGDEASAEAAAIEQAVETDALGIGSAPEQDLRLDGADIAERHATITFVDGAAQLIGRRGCELRVEGRSVERCTLQPGTIVSIGAHRLEITAPPTGFDLAIEIAREVGAKGRAAGPPPASFRGTRLAETWLAPRTAAWLLSLSVLFLALAVPLVHHLLDARERDPLDGATRDAAGAVLDPETRSDAAVAEAATGGRDPVAARLGWPALLGGDRIWSSGPLHDAHAALESDCGACHERLFQRVTNTSCERCHADTTDHVTAAAATANAHFSEPMNGRCASCHEEHDEPSTLVDQGDRSCAACHDDPALADAEGPKVPVTAFGAGTHPDFDVTLARPPDYRAPTATGDTTAPSAAAVATSPPGLEATLAEPWTVERLPLAGAKESSGLRFNHAVHADGERMSGAGGDGQTDGLADGLADGPNDGLACADCHTPRADGEHFEAPDFETDCASSGCHSLELDPSFRIPHGRADVAVAAIEGFYLKNFGGPDAAPAAREPRRRRPDRRASADDARSDCDGSSFDCALALAERKVTQQFTRTGCVTCHVVVPVADVDAAVPFAIAPVRLVADVHPAARFDHDSHGVLIEPGGDGSPLLADAACGECHAATDSTLAEDLSMPGIDTCTACHDGPSRTGNVPLGCVDCHEYHPASSMLDAGRDS